MVLTYTWLQGNIIADENCQRRAVLKAMTPFPSTFADAGDYKRTILPALPPQGTCLMGWFHHPYNSFMPKGTTVRARIGTTVVILELNSSFSPGWGWPTDAPDPGAAMLPFNSSSNCSSTPEPRYYPPHMGLAILGSTVCVCACVRVHARAETRPEPRHPLLPPCLRGGRRRCTVPTFYLRFIYPTQVCKEGGSYSHLHQACAHNLNDNWALSLIWINRFYSYLSYFTVKGDCVASK